MLLSIFNGIQAWLSQLQHVIVQQYGNLGPQGYSVMLILCILVGVILLRGRR